MSSDRAAIEADVRKFIIDQFMFGQDVDKLTNDVALVEGGIVDSTGVLEVISFLEERFGVKPADHELVPENLATVSAIVSFVLRKQGKA